jgi:hypothetical protein
MAEHIAVGFIQSGESMPAYLPLTLPDVIENALQIECNPVVLGKWKPDVARIRDLAFAVQSFYSNLPDFAKPATELRPYVAGNFAAGRKFREAYVAGSGRASEYRFDNRVQGELVSEVKRYLLYSHGLAFYDPLPYLLDHFRLDPHGEQSRMRLPALRSLLVEYSHLRELLRRGIVVPLADEVFGPIPVTLPCDPEALYSRLPNIKPEAVEILADIVIRGQIEIERAKRIIDPFFPTYAYVEVLREILRVVSAKFTKNDLEEPYRIGMLADTPAFNVDGLSLDDVVRIRLDEEVFERWRHAVRRILGQLHENAADSSDPEREAREVAADVLREWRSGLKKEAVTSSIKGIIKGAAKGAVIGAVSGGVLDPHGLAAAGTATVGALLQVAWDLSASRGERAISNAVRQHFLVLGQAA